MKLIYLLLSFLILSSCQSTPESVQLPNTEQKKDPSISEEIENLNKLPVSSKSHQTPPKKPVGQVQPPRVLSSCPAGINGQFVGKIEDGRYCFSRKKNLGCFKENEKEIQDKAKAHCETYQDTLKVAGVWDVKKDSHLELSAIKLKECQCGPYQGAELCKSFVSFQCEKVLLTNKSANKPIKKWEDLRYKGN